MSAYEAANAGYRDEAVGDGGSGGGGSSGMGSGGTGSGGGGWFGARPAAVNPAQAPVNSAGRAAGSGPVSAHGHAIGHSGLPAFGGTVPAPHSEGDAETLHLVVISAGLGRPSTARTLADRLADATRVRSAERGRVVAVEVLELRDLALDIAGAMVAGFPGERLRSALDAVAAADGLIAVSPVYTASYSGLFKSFFDVLDKDALSGKPTLIAATGGTARHSLALDHALRPMFAYLRAFIVPTGVFAASEDWVSAEALNERIERAGGELAGLMAGAPENRPAIRDLITAGRHRNN